MPQPTHIYEHPEYGPVLCTSYTGTVDGRISNWVDYMVLATGKHKGGYYQQRWKDITDQYDVAYLPKQDPAAAQKELRKIIRKNWLGTWTEVQYIAEFLTGAGYRKVTRDQSA
jgi:putative protein kinase ArgK-like GTPase of G3E family